LFFGEEADVKKGGSLVKSRPFLFELRLEVEAELVADYATAAVYRLRVEETGRASN